MKLSEIAPSRIFIVDTLTAALFEGLHVEEMGDGKYDFNYLSDVRDDDDPWFRGVTSSIPADKPTTRDLMTAGGSQEEIDELKQHIKEKGNYQKSIPIYWAMPMSNHNDKRQIVLDALKGRADQEFDPAGLHRLISDTAKRSADLISRYENIREYDNIVIIPLPSSDQLVQKFARSLEEHLSSKGVPVKLTPALKKGIPKIGMIGRGGPAGKFADFARRYKLTFTPREMQQVKSAYATYFAQVSDGVRTEDEALDFFEARIKYLNNKIKKVEEFLQANPTLPSAEEKMVKQATAAFEKELEMTDAYIDKLMNTAFDEVDPSTQRENDKHWKKIKKYALRLRRMVYDLIQVDDEALGPEGQIADGKTLVIMADDNVDTGKTLVDGYRSLYKKGLIDSQRARVVGSAMHWLGISNKDMI